MTFNVITDSRGGFRLEREGREIGWIEGRSIGFLGFESAKDARQGATTAYAALHAWLARQRRTDHVAVRRRVLNTRRDGGVTWLTLGDVPIGRIVHPHERDPLGEAGFGFELDLPPMLQPVNALSAAQVIDAALARRDEARRLEAAAGATAAGAHNYGGDR